MYILGSRLFWGKCSKADATKRESNAVESDQRDGEESEGRIKGEMEGSIAELSMRQTPNSIIDRPIDGIYAEERQRKRPRNIGHHHAVRLPVGRSSIKLQFPSGCLHSIHLKTVFCWRPALLGKE
ncbi:hypothetical protein OUZ56_015345 [Daphnia magna]|uniref:Uncharacterized protein n=1 Tax=Daphnia magna TaxID=35525 RepID=A0ABR0AMN1_9CRUS|nr:hypothetical protein OUZ56_015345 [Daphnia magna]